jgi:pimeloyl-ACP methyl ester carboxylesterase
MNESTRRERPPRLTPLLFGLASGALLLAGAFWFFPIEWNEAKNRFRLWQSGARPLQWEKHRGFQADRCDGKPPSECRCVWLLHGYGDSVSTWRRFFTDGKSFGEKPVRIFALDLPAHGGSLRRKNVEEYRASTMAREIDAGIGATKDCEKNVLIGNSFGGWVATLVALEDSPRTEKRYERLFLISPGGVKRAEEETKNLFAENSVESLKEFQRRAYFRPRELPESVWKQAAERMGSGSLSEVSKAQVDADRLDGKFAKLGTPTTLIWGEADRILSKAVMDVFLAGIRSARYVPLKECGHLPQKECPEALFSVIRSEL